MQGYTLVKAIAAVAVLVFISALALTVYKSGGAALNWQMGEDDPILKIYPSDDGLYVIGSSNVSLVDASGKALWSIPFPGTEFSTYEGGRLFVYSSGSGLNALGPDGSMAALTRRGMNYPPVVGPDGTIFIRSSSRLTALDPSGGEKWNVSGVVSGPTIDKQGYIYFFMHPLVYETDVYLECVGPDGSLRWSILYPKYDAGTRLMPSGAGGVIVYDEPEGIMARLSSSGNVTWDHTMPYLGEYKLVQDGYDRLYLFYLFGTVHVVNDRGTLVGKFNPVNTYDANMSYMPAVHNGTAYVLGDAGKDAATLYALGIDGSLKWQRTFNSSASPDIYADRNIVCIAAETKNGPLLYVIGDKGELKFTYNSGDGSRWEQVYVAGNDTIYAKTHDGMLYALKG